MQENDNLWEGEDFSSYPAPDPDPAPRPPKPNPLPASYRKLPEDTEAERAFLATVSFIANSPKGHDATSKLTPEDFMDPRHRILFEAMLALQKSETEVNAITLKNEIEAAGRLGQVGGYPTIVEILSGEEVARPEALADILREKTNLRSLAAMGSRIVESSFVLSSSDQIISEASEAITRLQSGIKSKQLITNMADLLEDLDNQKAITSANGGRAMSWGDESLDSMCPIPRGEPTLVVARPGVGKSALAIQIYVATIEKRLGKPLFLSLEMGREKIKARLAAHLSGLNSREFRDATYDTRAIEKIRSRQNVLFDGCFMFPNQQCPVEEIESLVRHAVDIHGVDCIILDQFSHIHAPKEAKKETFAISNSILSQRLTALAKNLNLGWVTLGQINRDGEDSRRPNMKDLADTDRLCKDAAVIFGLWNKGTDENQEVHGVIMKNRDDGHKGWSKQIDVDYGSCRFIVRENQTDSSFHVPEVKGWGNLRAPALTTQL